MTETTGTRGTTDTKAPLGVSSEAADRLKAELQDYLAVQAQRLLIGTGSRLGEATVKLTDVAEGRSPGLAKMALDGGRKLVEGKSPLRSVMEAGAGRLKENVTGAIKERMKGLKEAGGGRGKKGAGTKPTVIVEQVDVGVPVREAYDQWAQYQEFSRFAKGVQDARSVDDTTSDWKAKIFLSARSWKGHTTEQVPDDHISWATEGAKGTTKGVVSFHPLGDRLTRVLLIMEYYSQGPFEKTGNFWRAGPEGQAGSEELRAFRQSAGRAERRLAWRDPGRRGRPQSRRGRGRRGGIRGTRGGAGGAGGGRGGRGLRRGGGRRGGRGSGSLRRRRRA